MFVFDYSQIIMYPVTIKYLKEKLKDGHIQRFDSFKNDTDQMLQNIFY